MPFHKEPIELVLIYNKNLCSLLKKKNKTLRSLKLNKNVNKFFFPIPINNYLLEKNELNLCVFYFSFLYLLTTGLLLSNV